jgi:hypothetical protein
LTPKDKEGSIRFCTALRTIRFFSSELYIFPLAFKSSSVTPTLLSLYLCQNGESALHAAALSGSLPVCKQLIAAGADPNLKNQEGFTAAEVAQRHKHNVVNDYLRNCANRQPPSK